MTSPEHRAFIRVGQREFEGKWLSFRQAAELAATLIPESEFNLSREKSDGTTRNREQLAEFEINSEKYRHASNCLFDNLANGRVSAFVADRHNGLIHRVPTGYWNRPNLWTPYNSEISLSGDVDWQNAMAFNGQAFGIRAVDITRLWTKKNKTPSGRKPSYDWDGCKTHIFQILAEKGLPGQTKHGWKRQADVARAIEIRIYSQTGKYPGETTVKEKAREFISEFKGSKH